MRKKIDKDLIANCGKHLEHHQAHWFWIKGTKLWCLGKPWKGGGD